MKDIEDRLHMLEMTVSVLVDSHNKQQKMIRLLYEQVRRLHRVLDMMDTVEVDRG